jgi:hypothetical protein
MLLPNADSGIDDASGGPGSSPLSTAPSARADAQAAVVVGKAPTPDQLATARSEQHRANLLANTGEPSVASHDPQDRAPQDIARGTESGEAAPPVLTSSEHTCPAACGDSDTATDSGPSTMACTLGSCTRLSNTADAQRQVERSMLERLNTQHLEPSSGSPSPEMPRSKSHAMCSEPEATEQVPSAQQRQADSDSTQAILASVLGGTFGAYVNGVGKDTVNMPDAERDNLTADVDDAESVQPKADAIGVRSGASWQLGIARTYMASTHPSMLRLKLGGMPCLCMLPQATCF